MTVFLLGVRVCVKFLESEWSAHTIANKLDWDYSITLHASWRAGTSIDYCPTASALHSSSNLHNLHNFWPGRAANLHHYPVRERSSPSVPSARRLPRCRRQSQSDEAKPEVHEFSAEERPEAPHREACPPSRIPSFSSRPFPERGKIIFRFLGRL